MSTHTVLCKRLGQEAEGLDKPPFPGAEGQRIFDHISKAAWQEWLKVQTMLINEHRLTPFEAEAKKFLAQEREKYLFGGTITFPKAIGPRANSTSAPLLPRSRHKAWFLLLTRSWEERKRRNHPMHSRELPW